MICIFKCNLLNIHHVYHVRHKFIKNQVFVTRIMFYILILAEKGINVMAEDSKQDFELSSV